jgi:predicted Fe-Mo cluster-binding NifX family protein
MKIAVASEGNMVAQHFGHCEGFGIYTIEGSKISDKEFIKNPGHKPGFLPRYLNDLGVEIIVSGGMGRGAIDIFNEKGIEVITGAVGFAEDVVNKYIVGNLKSDESVCNKHENHDSCGH